MSDQNNGKAERGSIFNGISRWVIGALLGVVTLSTANAVFPPHPSYRTNAPITGQMLSGEGGAIVGLQGTRDYFTATNRYFLWNTTNRWVVINDSTDPSYTDTNTYAYRQTNDWAGTDPAEISAANNFNTLYTFFRVAYGRDGFDRNGAMASLHVHAQSYNNIPSFYGGQLGFSFGDGSPGMDGPSSVLDLCGWVYADAMIQNDLLYIGGQYGGALQISFCNIFGFLSEYYNQPDNLAAYPSVTPGQSDWLIGEDMKLNFVAIYDIRNPTNNLVERPRTNSFSGVSNGSDFDSGIQDTVFYYLCQGGSWTVKPLSTNIVGLLTNEVQAIGIDAAGRIAYRALTKYFTQNMDFLTARRAWVQAADDSDSSGQTTNAVESVMRAWAAVGVPDPAQIIYPGSGFVAGGEYPLGPYLPSQKTYWVFNNSLSNNEWAVSSSVPWIVVSADSLSITGRSYANENVSTNIRVSFNSGDIISMGEGYYTSSIIFTNMTISNAYFRNVTVGGVRNYQSIPTVYSWRTPASPPTYLPLSDDQVSGPISVPFANGWRFFAEKRTQVYIGANGLMGINPANMGLKTNSFLARIDTPNGIVAPLWDDWVPTTSSTSIFYFVRGTAPNREWVVTWNDMHHALSIDTRASFQVVIPEAATNCNNDILFQYRTITDSGEFGAGRSATIGVEDRLGFVGGMYSSNGTHWITSQRAILYSTNPPPVDTVPPTGEIVMESFSLAASSAVYVVRFSESVTGLALSDFDLSGSTAGGVAAKLEGAGMVYRLTVSDFLPLGTLSVGLPSGSVLDEAGLPNAVAIEPVIYIIPIQSKNPTEDFEGALEFWRKPTNNYANAWRDVWRQGVLPATNPPGYSYSGSQVLMAVVTNTDLPLDSWFESPEFSVGTNPIIQFAVWYDTQARLTVEAYDGTTWRNVTPGAGWTGSSYYWLPQQVALDNALFANRAIRVRFRLVGSDSVGIRAAVDAFQLVDGLNPGVYVLSYAPTNLLPSSVNPISYTIYNSSSSTVFGAVGFRSVADPGVTFLGPVVIDYGDLLPGDIQSVNVNIGVGALVELQGNKVSLFHSVTATVGRVGADVLDFTVIGATDQLGINRLTVKGGIVTNGLSLPLFGDGSLNSCVYQILDAGPDGIINPPSTNGAPTGDDQILYSITPMGNFAFGRFGDGAVPENAGYFESLFELFDPIPLYRSVYARAWDSDNFGTATAYGNSALVELATNGSQTVNFGEWGVGSAISNLASTGLITVSNTPLEGGTTLGGGNFAIGTLQSISATPNLFWRFVKWTDGDSNNPRSVLITSVGSNYVAEFTKELIPILISQIRSKGFSLSWNGTNQGVYRVETATNVAFFPTNNWSAAPGPLVTSLLNGVVVWTNPVTVTNTPQFWRVQWINAP
jgi:hypothetical protein